MAVIAGPERRPPVDSARCRHANDSALAYAFVAPQLMWLRPLQLERFPDLLYIKVDGDTRYDSVVL